LHLISSHIPWESRPWPGEEGNRLVYCSTFLLYYLFTSSRVKLTVMLWDKKQCIL